MSLPMGCYYNTTYIYIYNYIHIMNRDTCVHIYIYIYMYTCISIHYVYVIIYIYICCIIVTTHRQRHARAPRDPESSWAHKSIEYQICTFQNSSFLNSEIYTFLNSSSVNQQIYTFQNSSFQKSRHLYTFQTECCLEDDKCSHHPTATQGRAGAPVLERLAPEFDRT